MATATSSSQLLHHRSSRYAARDIGCRAGPGDDRENHHYEKIACLIQGQASASVIVAAAPTAMWAQERPLLLQAVAAYLVR